MLTQLGYVPNETLSRQLDSIKKNTQGYEKIAKHIMDLHDHLKVNKGYVALSNSHDYFKVKIDETTPESLDEAREKIEHFSKKFKVTLQQLPNKNTYYILGFEH